MFILGFFFYVQSYLAFKTVTSFKKEHITVNIVNHTLEHLNLLQDM